ncbi:carbohydrate ABC transporter permease [Actinomadura kijaniata]|uniref:carbohydrate ABC transporter permease n=1 Tax=Actinomadura kijaniata TaxID=46161 RepID=UPI000832107E|nr:sugar ABC transporter permease [Actinomadura kijaniata]
MAQTSPRRRRGAPILFLGPFLVLFAAFTLAPLGYAAWLSLFTERGSGLGFGGAETVFAGLGNYARALRDDAFVDGFAHIVAYCLVYIPVMIGAALLLALLLDSAYARARRAVLLGLFLPHAVPGIIAAIVWVFLYTPGLSPVVDLLRAGGIGWDFLSADRMLVSVVNIAAWQWTGYNVVIFFAALQAVPRDVLEAATIDGAGAARTAWSVKLPLIRPAVLTAALFTTIGALQLFTEPQVLFRAGAGIEAAWSPAMYAYNAAAGQDHGLAAASSLLLAAFAGLLSFLVTRLSARRRTA